ncbi:NADP-dependent oxidoreductase domain-containing protein [Rhexocercosporidium sp. MPI-PUGE-AT-0058]|nr:NADP-dependent oxidoreductase domain-containing protein [Rhexocercosporidium sp. MPI-PUGE-AT-0058]
MGYQDCGTIPPVGLGTFRLKRECVKPAVRDAIQLGYRHIDTASIYRNETEIGQVLQELYASDVNSLSRSDLWITSKLSPYDMATPRKALLSSLSALQTSYLDLYLIHWPAMARKPASSPENKSLRLEAWRMLNEAKKEGLVRHIGVSNFTVEHLNELSETQWGIGHAFVQMEIHPWYWKDAAEIQRVFSEHNLTVVGYALLAEGKLLANDCPAIIDQISEKTGLTKVQVVLAWALSRGWGVLAKSVDTNHLRQNLETLTLVYKLTADDILAMDEISSEQEEKQCWDPRLVK